MTVTRAARTPRTSWSALALVVGLVAAVAALPGLRAAGAVLAAVGSVSLVLVGVRLHRPTSRVWLLVALTLATWGAATVLSQLGGDAAAGRTGDALIAAGQAIAALVVVHVARMGTPEAAAQRGSRVDLVIMATVLGLVVAQLVAAATADASSLAALVIPTVDVTIIGLLLRFVVTRPRLPVSSYLALAGAVTTTVYDLACAVQGRRLPPPGDPVQILGVLCVLLFGVAALHPSMVQVFDASRFSRRRPASVALLGLLPLVAVPAGLWWVSWMTEVPGLPNGVLVVSGSFVAGLCLVRAARALRDSEHLASHDPLTDLANRRGLARAFADEPPAGGRSMLLIDIDEFKQVNDTHGHDVGDALLLGVRDRLLTATSAGREVVARLGGDEFVVLTATDTADATADRVLRALRAPVEVHGLDLRVSASIGVAHAEPGTSLVELLTRSDVAMYAAKAAGRDTAVEFHPDMRTEVSRRFALTSEVRQLLAARSPDVGRLEVHYQPLVELRSGQVVGAEALVRWRHPEHGLLPPGDFLGIVSRSGLDARLDRVVLLDVLSQLRQWRDRGLRPLPVSVNLTGDSLGDPELAEQVLTALADAGVPASQVHVEITEHQQLPEDSPAARSLRRLHEAGVATHLDDYGVGYTSLDYLHRFPVEVLKLDRSVVASMSDGPANLVAGVVAMASAWDLALLAEGVETAEQREQLVAAGVRYGQGYLFSRPLPAARYEVLLGRVGSAGAAVLPAATERPRPAPLVGASAATRST
ncbi:bifunctional diguanylate cyclase/phosphodiesterase [uncultured Cellulomonas sp.]|uniref:putative bifunctional diguanylate cyclase/phosphodiesterase n=1 Tax=uncultured Cellulomonas sp. TaxID=189682 RepID=UPI00261F6A0A|nr:EAL domain-containing protein [uncultured Cellulomonas sp.]